VHAPTADRALRNIGISAHIDAGKTRRPSASFSTRAFRTRSAKCTTGAAVMDYMEQEQERGITITAAATTAFWKGMETIPRAPLQHHRHPGTRRLTIEVERSLRVLDSACAVFCAVSGVQPSPRRSGAR